jgi:hypothetical protein
MFESIPYWCRIVLLLFLMSLIAAIDWHRNRQNATKWKEYGFVILSGVMGTLFGLFNDLITSSISPEYFIFGKGLASGDWLTVRAGVLGMKAGFSVGAIAGAICLYVSTRNCSRPPLAYRKLLRLLWRPVALAIAVACISALFFCQHDPLAFSAQLEGLLDSQQIHRFLLVWWIHAGLYCGLLVSVIWIIVDIGRLRKRELMGMRQGSQGHG